MDSPSGLQNELKDSLPVIVSDIVMDASTGLQSELRDTLTDYSSQVDPIPCG